MRLNFVGLYSGCGGADSGFIDEGYKSLGAFDNDPTALSVHKANLAGPVFQEDLRTVDFSNNPLRSNVDVVFSGAPCQGFSTAGNMNIGDPRNDLLVHGGTLAIELETKVFVAENVMGSLSPKFKSHWDVLEQQFKERGYKTQLVKVNCLDYGMGQTRKRVLFIAWKGGPDRFRLPQPKKPLTLREVLANMNGTPNHEGFALEENGYHVDIMNNIKVNQKLCNVRGGIRSVPTWEIPEVFGFASDREKEILEALRTLRRRIRLRDFGDADPVHLKDVELSFGENVKEDLEQLVSKGYLRKVNGSRYDLTKTFNGKYKRLDWGSPAPTVDTRFGNPIYFLHPDENRGFTVREAARIQGFPDEFIFSGSIRDQFRMIGNAFPPVVSREIAKAIKEQLISA